MPHQPIVRIDSTLALNRRHRVIKRLFDILFSVFGLAVSGWLIGLAVLAARWSTGRSGLFRQRRVGRYGRDFTIYKIRTMSEIPGISTSVTTDLDPRVTRFGRFLRKFKIDELPQLYNVLRGDMSVVGPRPDVADLVSTLQGPDRIILAVRPGITGPASIKYRNEETLLAAQGNPDLYNRTVIYPDKTRLNREYVEQYRFIWDIQLLIQTITGGGATATVIHNGSIDREYAA